MEGKHWHILPNTGNMEIWKMQANTGKYGRIQVRRRAQRYQKGQANACLTGEDMNENTGILTSESCGMIRHVA